MKRLTGILVSAALVLIIGMGSVSCGKPKIIPDEKLARIFHDTYLVNAYTQNNHTLKLDSLNIYEPVFAKYGYTAEDVQFTIGNFAKRKSERLSDIVDQSIQMLEKESRFYRRRIAVYDTIGLVAREHSARVIYTDTLISVRRIADTSLLRIVIPVKEPGTYEASYYYFVDSTDRNTNLRVNQYLLDSLGRQSANTPRRLKHSEVEKVTATFGAGENHRKLVLNLNGYNGVDDLKKPSMTVDTLVVRYFLPDNEARTALGRSWFDYRAIDTLPRPAWNAGHTVRYVLLPDEPSAKDIVALPADTRGTSAP